MIRLSDTLQFSWRALRGYPTRTILMLLATAISVAAVVLLTALGEGARGYVANEFASLGTNLVIVIPGRSETSGGGLSNMVSTTPRDLTLDDAKAVQRHPMIDRIAPLAIGAAEIAWQGRKREISVMGSNHSLMSIRHWKLSQGQFLPNTDLERASPVCIIGSKIRDEIFGANPAVGQWVRLGDRRYRVIGVMASEGRSIGVDVQDVVIIPVASAQALFNTPSLYRILIQTKNRESMPRVIEFVKSTIRERHQGEEDVTVITQDAVLETFDSIIGALTYAVGGIAAISLAVAGILIMNVMLVAVSQRTSEVGLLKALGTSSRQILILILVEAVLLSAIGAAIGLLIGQFGSWGIRAAFPNIPAYPPLWAILASVFVALGTGALFSLLPARKAARLDPVLSLSKR